MPDKGGLSKFDRNCSLLRRRLGRPMSAGNCLKMATILDRTVIFYLWRAQNTRCGHQAWTRTCGFCDAHTLTTIPNNHPSTANSCCDSRETFAGTPSWWDCRMGCLPDELWTKILGMGVGNQVLDYRDLCSLAFVCRRIRRISSLDCMWRPLWERDQAELGGGSSLRSSGAALRKDDDNKNFRDLYRVRFERVRAAKMAAHRRRVLRVESQVAVLQKEAQQYQLAIKVERKKLVESVAELRTFELARRSAVTIQVWQPQAVRARQQEVLEQQSVNVGARQRALQMEINVCRDRVQQFEKSLQAKRSAIEKSSRELEALTFNPSRNLHDSLTADERADRKAALKRKRDTSSSSSQTPQTV